MIYTGMEGRPEHRRRSRGLYGGCSLQAFTDYNLCQGAGVNRGWQQS
jgi:hypothetical protein